MATRDRELQIGIARVTESRAHSSLGFPFARKQCARNSQRCAREKRHFQRNVWFETNCTEINYGMNIEHRIRFARLPNKNMNMTKDESKQRVCRLRRSNK